MPTGPSQLPYVSVIVPVRNDASGLATLLPALLAQTYPRDRIQVLVADNASTDETWQVARRYAEAHPDLVQILIEPELGAYAARNAALRVATGDVLAFTDADCTPAPDWLEAGVRALQEHRADLVGGQVGFALSQRPTAAALYDAATNMRNRYNIATMGAAVTANLLVTRRVIETIGPFPGEFHSGEDVHWTLRATRAGLLMVYAPDAVVRHPTRELGALLRKSARVGRGQPAIWRALGYTRWRTCRALLGGLLPRSPRRLQALAAERGITIPHRQMLSVWSVGWATHLATTWGRVGGLLR
jgi:glycosyltransferase AglE